MITAAQLLRKDFPLPRYAVPSLIAEGATLLVSPPKLGKSWLMLNIAQAVARGGTALGKVQVEEGDVFYLALEDSERRMQARLEMVLKGEPAPHRLHFAFDWPAFVHGGGNELQRQLEMWPGCRLVVIDVLARLRNPVADRSDRYMADYMVMEQVKKIADRANVPIVIVHHTRKAGADDFVDSVSGTHGLAGAADSVLVLKRSRTQADAELSVTGRDVPEQTHALKFAAEVGTWSLLGDVSEWNVSEQRRAIIHALRMAGGELGPKEIAEASGVDYDVCRQLLLKMADQGQIDKHGYGTYSHRSLHSQSALEV